MKPILAALLMVGTLAAQTAKPPEPPKMVCWDGFSATKDTQKECKGDWIENKEGKQYPSGDACNTSTCMDAACRYSVSTLVACAYHPFQIAPVPAPEPPKAKLGESDFARSYFGRCNDNSGKNEAECTAANLSWVYPCATNGCATIPDEIAEPPKAKEEPTLDRISVMSIDQEGSGRVDRLTDTEYSRLQKLRQAVADAEKEIAVAHGVKWVPLGNCKSPPIEGNGGVYAVCLPPDLVPDSIFEFRGQFLLIDVPSAAKEAK